MDCMYLLQLLSLIVVVLQSISACDLDSPALKVNLRRCRKLEDTFLRKFNTFKNGVKGERAMCRMYSLYKTCMSPLMEGCTDIKEQYERRWRLVDQHMVCTCKHKQRECRLRSQCIRVQVKSLLVRRCDIMYRFQKKQKVYGECNLLQEVAVCKDRLLRSSCGQKAGKIGLHLHRLAYEHHHSKHKCSAIPKTDIKSFAYSLKCPVKNFTESNEKCYGRYIQRQMLDFKSDNDLIASGSSGNITKACRLYKKYRACMEPMYTHCKDGLNLIISMDGRMRTYLQKIEYICDRAQESYSKNLQCLQATITNQTLKVCNPIWEQIHPSLKDVTAYEFYCQSQVNGSITYNLHQHLRSLRDCYQAAYAHTCGAITGRTMGDLMHLVFNDPFYLRFSYMPPCRSNLKPTLAPSTVAPKSTTQIKRFAQPIHKDEIAKPKSDVAELVKVSAHTQSDASRTIVVSINLVCFVVFSGLIFS